MTITIFHNPACGTSRNTLAMIRQSGETPEVIEYLKPSPNRERLVELLGVMGMTPRDLLRKKGTPYAELGLYDPSLSDAAIPTPRRSSTSTARSAMSRTTPTPCLCRAISLASPGDCSMSCAKRGP